MEHAEDNVLNAGVDGTKQTIDFLRAVRDMLAGNAERKVDITVKFDGAPAVFAGIDPSDGKFFVAKKGIFAKNPKVYKTMKDIEADTQGDLQDKLKLALQYLPELNIKGVIQGDFMFAQNDLKTINHDGEEYVSFHPNTIVYAVPKNSALGKEIQNAKIGIVWHTKYVGDSFQNMSAQFAKPIASSLSSSKNVFFRDAEYRDISGKATMTKDETLVVTQHLSNAGTLFQKMNRSLLDSIADNEELRIRVKTFYNKTVRSGYPIKNTDKFTTSLIKYIYKFYEAEKDKKKSARGKQASRSKQVSVLEYFVKTPKNEIKTIFDMMNELTKAKNILVKKMDNAKDISTLLLTDNGYQVTGQEGFVAVDRISGDAVKLVDRLQFSYANFSSSVKKGWVR